MPRHLTSVYGTILVFILLGLSISVASASFHFGESEELTEPTAPDVQTQPSSYDFGNWEVGTYSGTATITVTNVGTADLVVTSSGTDGDFGLSGTTCWTTDQDGKVTTPAFAPGESCTFDLYFYPQSAGQHTGDFYFYSNDPDSLTYITLSGTGYVVTTAPTEEAPSGPVCGDKKCDSGEDSNSCPGDCPAAAEEEKPAEEAEEEKPAEDVKPEVEAPAEESKAQEAEEEEGAEEPEAAELAEEAPEGEEATPEDEEALEEAAEEAAVSEEVVPPSAEETEAATATGRCEECGFFRAIGHAIASAASAVWGFLGDVLGFAPRSFEFTPLAGEDPFVRRPPNLSDNTGDSRDAKVATSGSNVYVVWADNESGNFEILLSISRDSGVTFTEPQNISNSSTDSRHPTMLASGRQIYIAWEEIYDATVSAPRSGLLYTWSFDDGATFRRPVDIELSGQNEKAMLSAGGGNVWIAWTRNENYADPDVMVKNLTTNRTFGLNFFRDNYDRDRDRGVFTARNVKIAVDSEGNAHAVWEVEARWIYYLTTSSRIRFGTDTDVFYAKITDRGFGIPTYTDSREARPRFQRTAFSIFRTAGNEINPSVYTQGNNVYVIYDAQGVRRLVEVFKSTDRGASFLNAGRYDLRELTALSSSDLPNALFDYATPLLPVGAATSRGLTVAYAPYLLATTGSIGANSILLWSEETRRTAQVGSYRPATIRSASAGDNVGFVFDSGGEIYFTSGASARNVSNNAGTSSAPDLAFSGTSPVVVWEDNSSGNWDIYFATVAP